MTHGPLAARDYELKINRRMKTRALYTILSRKFRDGELLLLDELKLPSAKTSEAQKTLNQLATLPGYSQLNYRRGRRTLLALPRYDAGLLRSFRNLPGLAVTEARELNPLTALTYRYLVLADPAASLAALAKRGA